jgi:hypothetical protein
MKNKKIIIRKYIKQHQWSLKLNRNKITKYCTGEKKK